MARSLALAHQARLRLLSSQSELPPEERPTRKCLQPEKATAQSTEPRNCCSALSFQPRLLKKACSGVG